MSRGTGLFKRHELKGARGYARNLKKKNCRRSNYLINWTKAMDDLLGRGMVCPWSLQLLIKQERKINGKGNARSLPDKCQSTSNKTAREYSYSNRKSRGRHRNNRRRKKQRRNKVQKNSTPSIVAVPCQQPQSIEENRKRSQHC